MDHIKGKLSARKNSENYKDLIKNKSVNTDDCILLNMLKLDCVHLDNHGH